VRTVLEESTKKKFRYDENGNFLKTEVTDKIKFKYSDKESREAHIQDMEKLGWTLYGKALINTGISPTGPVYAYVGEFYKNNSFMTSGRLLSEDQEPSCPHVGAYCMHDTSGM
jgi:hypothetical protein